MGGERGLPAKNYAGFHPKNLLGRIVSAPGGGGTGTGRVSLFMALLPDCHAMQVTSQCSLNFSWQTQLGPSPSPCQVQEISQIDEPSENAPTEGAQSPSMPAEPAKPTHPEVSHINICHTPPLPSV